MRPSCKGEQSLTFKRHQRSTVARWEGCQVHTLKIRPKPLADSSSITPMSEINRKVWTWNTKDSLLSLDYFTLKLDYQKPWPIAIFISENSSLLSKKYDFLLGKATKESCLELSRIRKHMKALRQNTKQAEMWNKMQHNMRSVGSASVTKFKHNSSHSSHCGWGSALLVVCSQQLVSYSSILATAASNLGQHST